MRRMSAVRLPTPAASPGSEPAPISPAYRRYALGLLLVVYVSNFIDRQILTILADAIRLELGLSDTALGFLGGFAFAFFYRMRPWPSPSRRSSRPRARPPRAASPGAS